MIDNTQPDVSVLKGNILISNMHKFYTELEKYITYIFTHNGRSLSHENALEECRAFILEFLISLGEIDLVHSENEKKFIKYLFNPKQVEIPEKTSRIEALKRRQRILSKIPNFLYVVKEFRNSREHLNVIINSITKIALNFAANDKELDNTEIKYITNVRENFIKELLGGYYLNDNILDDINKIKKNIEQTTAKISSTDDLLKKLDQLIGLEDVKSEVTTLINIAIVNNIRAKKNFPKIETSKHLVFTGNPGTRKTTVARIIGEIYGSIGILSKGHFIEATRSDLVGEYVGQTAQKTQDIINRALGGVLFIDEAYSLAQGGKEDYGSEAIAELLKLMEDHRDDLVVIVAGYTNEMHKFIDMNPGLSSRFNKYIAFKDYSAEELSSIMKLLIINHSLKPDSQLEELYKSFFSSVEPKTFANARGVRNMFEKMMEAQANRVMLDKKITSSELQEITASDFYEAIQNYIKPSILNS